MAKPIKMSFWLRSRVGPRNHVLDGVHILSWEEAILKGEGHPIVTYRNILWWTMQKWLNRLRCHLGCWVGNDPRNHLLDGGTDFEGERHAPTCSTTLWCELCKNVWTNQDAVSIMDSGGPKEACIRWGPDPPCKRAILGGKDMPEHAQQYSAMSCEKMAEPIDMPFGLLTGVGRRKHMFNCIC